MADPEIAVITVSYRSEGVLPAFLASLADASAQPMDVIVADNLPVTGSAVRSISEAAHVQYLPVPTTPGYGGAINAAAKSLGDGIRWIVVANPDVIFGAGSIDSMVDEARSDPSIGAVGPLIVTDGRVYPSARRVPSLLDGAGHALFSRVWPSNPWSRRYRDERTESPVTRDAGWLSGSCLVVRRTAFESIGGFDEEYFMYFEDVDLGHRLSENGWRNRYLVTAMVEHTGAHSTAGDSSAMNRAHHDSAYRFLASRYHHVWQAPLRLALKIGLRLRSRH